MRFIGSTYAVIAAPVLTVPYGDPLKIGQRILWTGHYEAFGRPDSLRPVCPGFFPNPIQYTGYYSDGDIFRLKLEHYYAKARYYDPYTGRFLGRDPADFDPESFPGAVNRYTYAANNPLRYVDPDGEFFFTALFGLAFEALFYDVALFAILGGTTELYQTQNATLGTFLKGALWGGVSGLVSSFTAGVLFELSLANATLNNAIYGSTLATNILDSATNAFLVGWHSSDYYRENLLPFPRRAHHGASGWGALSRVFGLTSWLNSGTGGIISKLSIVAGTYLTMDDFVQHVCIQPFDENAHFLANTLYRLILNGIKERTWEWNYYE